jgi:D-alanine-D-alanine ligase
MARPNRVIALYNVDFDDAPDASAVEAMALAIVDALRESGYTAKAMAIAGADIGKVMDALRVAQPDLVFNLCESMAGDPRNEPTFVGMLDLFRIPYTGSDLLALASCLHKHRAKDILVGRGVPTPPFRVLDRGSLDPGPLAYPLFLKLVHEDASIGITEENLVRDADQLRRRASAMIEEYRQPVLAEGYIEVRILPLHEIDFGAMPADRPRIVSYAAKWDEAHVDYAGTKPVPLRDATPALVGAVERVARGAWDALGLRDYGRVDLRIDGAGQPWVIDVNPNPDISPDAGVARSAKVAGMTYVDLIDAIARTAWRRFLQPRGVPATP